MYLSRIAIDTKKYKSMKALYNMERLHGMVENSFTGERRRNLWRLDQLAGDEYLLLLSPFPPENHNLPKQIGYEGDNWETKSYDGLLNKVSNGSEWYFRLTANPTVSRPSSDGKRGKVKAVIITIDQKNWLKRQAEKHGFIINDNEFGVVRSEWKEFKKNGRTNRILSVTFEGVLTVSDKECFTKALIEGIGREKAYGMGLLTVMPYAR